MNESEKNQMKQWIQNWEKAGKAMEQVRRKELFNFDFELHRKAIDGLLEMASQHGSPRITSGLVEQQRLFTKAFKQMTPKKS